MKFLLDQNISFKVKKMLREIYPDVKHLSDIELTNKTDVEIFNYAKELNYVIVTKDSDFADLSLIKENPPKIICLKFGNSSSMKVAHVLINENSKIVDFIKSTDSHVLELY